MTDDNHVPIPDGEAFHPLEGDSFGFACHPKVPCFNECCADLTLVLTPYDILRLKDRLALDSSEFLETHTNTETAGSRFPRVLLKMTDKPGKPCPFVTPQGCSVYEDRPGACRIYPLGRGAAKGGREFFFLVKEDHCKGFGPSREWTTAEWMKDQGLTEYNRHNDRFMEIITAKNSLGDQEHILKKVQMFFMAAYNQDRFRDFVFKSRFLEKFDLEESRIENVRTNNGALLELAYDWLHFALYGEKTIPLK